MKCKNIYLFEPHENMLPRLLYYVGIRVMVHRYLYFIGLCMLFPFDYIRDSIFFPTVGRCVDLTCRKNRANCIQCGIRLLA